MRSARVVSTVTKTMFGASACAARLTLRITRRRANRERHIRGEKGVYHLQTPWWQARSQSRPIGLERQFHSELHVTLSPRAEDGIKPEAHIRCGKECAESARTDLTSRISEHGMI